MPEPVYKERTLFLCINEDGDITADMEKELAIQRMDDLFGGERYVVEMTIKVPRPSGYLESIITVPLEEDVAGPIVLPD